MSDTARRDPTERELADYVRYRLERIGPLFAEPQYVEEALVFHRDLWLELFIIDRDSASGRFGDPS